MPWRFLPGTHGEFLPKYDWTVHRFQNMVRSKRAFKHLEILSLKVLGSLHGHTVNEAPIRLLSATLAFARGGIRFLRVQPLAGAHAKVGQRVRAKGRCLTHVHPRFVERRDCAAGSQQLSTAGTWPNRARPDTELWTRA